MARSASVLACTLLAGVVSFGTVCARTTHELPPGFPLVDGPITRQKWEELMACHLGPEDASNSLVCMPLAQCRETRCQIASALGASADQIVEYDRLIAQAVGPGAQAPTTFGTLAIQRLLRRHPDWRAPTEGMLVTLARDLQDFFAYSITFAIATLVDPSGLTEHRMADAVPFTPDFDEAISNARENCDTGRTRACRGIHR